MTDVSELKRLVKALQGASSDKETIEVLHVLRSEAKINEALLRESKAGLAVGKLRNHGSKDVASLAKDLVKKWRAEVDREKAASGKSAPARKASLTPTTPTIPARNGSRTAKSDGVNTSLTGDKTRDKCIELVYDGLATESEYPSDLLLNRAKSVEEAVKVDCKGITPAYKSKIRSLYVNLKEKNNSWLRDGVASGDIAARDFARMSSKDMASEERRAEDKKIEQENFFKTLGAGEQEAETDAFQCGRCKQRKCRYRQAQTRSADEPMTTFVTCTNCNHRWKFS